MESRGHNQSQPEACFCRIGKQAVVDRGSNLADQLQQSEGLAVALAQADGSACCDTDGWDGASLPPPAVAYDRTEQDVLLEVFADMLRSVTKDGGRKRAAGTKPPWWRDGSHEGAIFSHLTKWKRGERKDSDSGSHPLVHAAWRMLAIAYQETYGKVDPQ